MIFKIDLSSDDVELIGQALDERPYKTVVSLVARIQSQINTQLASGEPPPIKKVSRKG